MAKTKIEEPVETEKEVKTEVETNVETETEVGKEYIALVSFSGQVSMCRGSKKKISDKNIIKDLLKAGYIEEVK